MPVILNTSIFSAKKDSQSNNQNITVQNESKYERDIVYASLSWLNVSHYSSGPCSMNVSSHMLVKPLFMKVTLLQYDLWKLSEL